MSAEGPVRSRPRPTPAAGRRHRGRRWLRIVAVVLAVLFATLGFWAGVLLAQPDGNAIVYGVIGEIIWLPLTAWWGIRSVTRRRAKERARKARQAERARVAAQRAQRHTERADRAPVLDTAATHAGRAVGRLLARTGRRPTDRRG